MQYEKGQAVLISQDGNTQIGTYVGRLDEPRLPEGALVYAVDTGGVSLRRVPASQLKPLIAFDVEEQYCHTAQLYECKSERGHQVLVNLSASPVPEVKRPYPHHEEVVEDDVHLSAWHAAEQFRKLPKPRELVASEVRFAEREEAEEMAPDFPDDPDYEREIRARLEQDDNSAWCCLVVEARWRGYVGYASLGGYSFPEKNSGSENREYATDEFEQLRVEALDHLNLQVRNAFRQLYSLWKQDVLPKSQPLSTEEILKKTPGQKIPYLNEEGVYRVKVLSMDRRELKASRSRYSGIKELAKWLYLVQFEVLEGPLKGQKYAFGTKRLESLHAVGEAVRHHSGELFLKVYMDGDLIRSEWHLNRPE